ncbi:hypothetical protein ACT009_14820 [Sphingomonas sp. Tas61C01]|uniref:hypothetical protein n=1 Tax=Sphingomonas sp. Tas61C01 TaxID=3458297 RepID=UPI00403EF40A
MAGLSSLLFIGLLAVGVASVPVVAQQPSPAQVASFLDGLTQIERDTLIGKLQMAQSQLRSRAKLTFELVSGGPAFYDVTAISPRRAFIEMSFDKPYSIKREADGVDRQNYELIYFPPGANSLMWKVRVAVAKFEPEDLQRVELIYTAPPPF